MKLKREERYISYFHKPIVQGWTTPSSSWRRWRRCWGEMETTPTALRRSFPPPICRSRSLFRGFSVCGRLLAIYVGGAIFIVGFRSRWSCRRKDRRQLSHEASECGPHAAKESGRVGHPLLGLRPLLVCLLRSQVFFLPKTDARKFSAHLDVIWVLETSNYRK